MSNFQTKAKRPEGTEFEEVAMIDGYYMDGSYGVHFPDGVVFEEDDCEFEKIMSKETIEKSTDEANKEQKKLMDKK